jgi:hypothetical protein
MYCGPYDEKCGGSLALHKLCSIINDLGGECYIYPEIYTENINLRNSLKSLIPLLRSIIKSLLNILTFGILIKKRFKTNPFYKTPIIKSLYKIFDSNYIVIYPETVCGNPLQAKNIIRWILYKPGFHNSRIWYGSGEIYYDYNNYLNNLNIPGSRNSQIKLHVVDFDSSLNLAANKKRFGVAYCIRKGLFKNIPEIDENSICVDNLKHQEILKILKQVKTFISFDPYTGYSILAALMGADSVVIPIEGVSKEEWYPDIKNRYGVAYGFEELSFARNTANLLSERLINLQKESINSVKEMLNESSNYFSN